jgi:hypothetical protein
MIAGAGCAATGHDASDSRMPPVRTIPFKRERRATGAGRTHTKLWATPRERRAAPSSLERPLSRGILESGRYSVQPQLESWK